MKSAYHHGDLKNALLTIAREQLADRGEDKLSLRDVSATAGVSHNAAYRHFPDKRSLLAELAAQGFRELVPASLAEAIDSGTGDPADQLREYGLAYVRFGVANPKLLRLMFSAQLSGADKPPQLDAAAARAYGLLTRITEAGQQSGRFAAAAPEDLRLSCWAMVHGLATLLAGQRAPGVEGEAATAAAAERALALFMQGIAPGTAA